MRDIAYLYAFEGMADWEYGYLVAELNSGRYFAAPPTRERGARLEVRTAASSLVPIRTMGGLRILPDCAVGDVYEGNCALLILPGGDGWLDPMHAPIVEKARVFLSLGIPVAAICGATAALANAGILDDRAHTSNDLGYLKAVCAAYKGASLYRDAVAVLDRGLITATGVAPLEFAHLVMKSLGLFSDETLEAWLGLFGGHEPQCFFDLMDSIKRGEA
jgi:putative intracellular protease/amidase